MMTRQSGVKIFFSVTTAPIVLAHLIDFLIRRCHVNPPMIEYSPANLICLAYSRYKHVHANTIGVVNVHILNTQSDRMGNWSLPIGQYLQRFAYSSRQCLFIKLQQRKAGVLQRNNMFKFKITFDRHNPRLMHNFTVYFPTPLIFRCHLPLRRPLPWCPEHNFSMGHPGSRL